MEVPKPGVLSTCILEHVVSKFQLSASVDDEHIEAAESENHGITCGISFLYAPKASFDYLRFGNRHLDIRCWTMSASVGDERIDTGDPVNTGITFRLSVLSLLESKLQLLPVSDRHIVTTTGS